MINVATHDITYPSLFWQLSLKVMGDHPGQTVDSNRDVKRLEPLEYEKSFETITELQHNSQQLSSDMLELQGTF